MVTVYPARYTPDYLKSKCIIRNDCWEWQGKLSNGYATIAYKIATGKTTYKRVHRMMYEFFKGDIPERLVIDHLCNNTICINPNHLDAKTIFDNAARTGHASALNKVKTQCKRGHPFDKENTYINPNNGTRHCRICKKAQRSIA